MLKNSGSKKIISNELPAFCLSMLIAEAFYEFGSFILECGAFLLTWWAISYCIQYIRAGLKQHKTGVTETSTLKLK